MADACTDNRFEVIEEYKRKLIEATNIETSPDEMNVLDSILFRFWQMGWLETITRMQFVKESANTLIHSVGETDSAKAFRNAGRFIWNAIDGEPQDFEEIPKAAVTQRKRNTAFDVSIEALKYSEVPNSSDCISRQAAIDAIEERKGEKYETD